MTLVLRKRWLHCSFFECITVMLEGGVMVYFGVMLVVGHDGGKKS
jgi:hypothetical protein